MARRMWTRTLAIALALLAAGAGFTAVAAPVLTRVSLPRDHGAHPRFAVEWWYTTGTARGSDGHRYFWFATAWAAPQGVVSRVNLLDLHTGRTVAAHESLTVTPPRPRQRTITAGTFSIALGSDRRWRVHDTAPAAAGLTLTLTPEVPYVLHGRHGLITQGPGGRSAYYSEPRLAARGSFTRAGRTVRLTGLGWLDHQWGNFRDQAGSLRWNWFACQLHDGRDLMLYEFLDAQGRPSGVQAGTLVTRSGRVTHLHAFTIRALAPAIQPAGAHARYPLGWALRAAGLHMRLRSLTRNGFITNTLVPSFWEAPAVVTSGPAGGCIVESSREV